MIGRADIVHERHALLLQGKGGHVAHDFTPAQQHRPADKLRYLLQKVGGEEHGLGGLENAQEHLVKVLAVENVVPGEGLIHEDIVRALGKGENYLQLVLLAGGKGAHGLFHGQIEKIHQPFKPLGAEAGELGFVERPVVGGGEVGEKGVLAGGEGESGNILPGDGLAVQGHRALVAEVPQDAFHQRGLACAVFTKQSHNLAWGEGEIHAHQGIHFSNVGLGDRFQFQHGNPSYQSCGLRHCAGVAQR